MLASFFLLALFAITNNQLVPNMKGSSANHLGEASDCWVLVQTFSNTSSQFTMCATRNAKPILLCHHCVREFLTVRAAYRAIESNHLKGVNCKKLLDGKDRLQILTHTWANIGGKHGLWTKGYCDACYTQPLNKHSRLRKQTADFQKLAAKVEICFRDNPNPGNQSHPAGACAACRDQYSILNSFYKENFPSQPHIDGVCIDTLDTLNRTQKLWGTDRYFCNRKIHNDDLVIVVAFFILFSPLMFYLTAGYFGHTAKLRTVANSRWLDMVQPVPLHGEAVDYEHAYNQEDGWYEHEHGWERDRKSSRPRQRKTSSIVREALLRALREASVSEAELQFDLEADAGQQPDAGGEVIGRVDEVQDEAEADVKVDYLTRAEERTGSLQVQAQVHDELQTDVHDEVLAENGAADTLIGFETEAEAQKVCNDDEENASGFEGNPDENPLKAVPCGNSPSNSFPGKTRSRKTGFTEVKVEPQL